jgi:hypothetical protein
MNKLELPTPTPIENNEDLTLERKEFVPEI